MTCVCAVTDGHRIVMGADSAGVSGWSLTRRLDRKIGRNGPYVIGFTTSYRMGQLLLYAFRPPEPPHDADDLMPFMVTQFVDAARNCLKAGGWAKAENSREDAGCWMVGVVGRLFTIESDYQVAESMEQAAAIGCGTDAALGALLATPLAPPRRRILDALSVAEKLSSGVRAPFFLEESPDA